MKNENMKRDMRKACKCRFIYGDETILRKIALIYNDCDIWFVDNYRSYTCDDKSYKTEELGFAIGIRCSYEEWESVVKNLGLKVDKRFRQRRVWKIA